MNGVLWGLMGAMLIGASDCIARVTTQRVSTSILFLCIMGLSFATLSFGLLFHADWPPWHPQAWLASALSGVLNLVALFFLYRALARGPVAVASPAASTFTVLLVLMNMLAGETWTVLQLLAVLVVFGGVVMLSRPAAIDVRETRYDAQWLRVTAAYGLAAAFSVSLRMFLAQEASGPLGAMHALYLNRAFALLAAVVLVAVLLARSVRLTWPDRGHRRLILLQAIFETAALGAFLIGSLGTGRVGATIGFSAFAAATVLFARVWLKERVGWQRAAWIGVIAAGLALALVGGP